MVEHFVEFALAFFIAALFFCGCALAVGLAFIILRGAMAPKQPPSTDDSDW